MRRYPHRSARRTARGNRQGLALVGVVLTAVGAAVPLLVYGPFDPLPPGAAEETLGSVANPTIASEKVLQSDDAQSCTHQVSTRGALVYV